MKIRIQVISGGFVLSVTTTDTFETGKTPCGIYPAWTIFINSVSTHFAANAIWGRTGVLLFEFTRWIARLRPGLCESIFPELSLILAGPVKNTKNAASDVPGIKTRTTTKNILAAVRKSKGRFAGQKVED